MCVCVCVCVCVCCQAKASLYNHLDLSSTLIGLPRNLSSKESVYNAGDTSLIPESGRFPGEGNGHPFQYTCWEIQRMDEHGGLQSIRSQESQT